MSSYLIWILTSILYAPVFFDLYYSRWDNVDYTHAYFILPIALWLTWRKRGELKKIVRNQKNNLTSSIFGLSLLSLALLLFVFGWRQEFLLFTTFSLVPFLFGLIIYRYGINMVKSLSFPVLYLLLLVPPPFGIIDTLTLPMRHGVSVVTEIILELLNYPITRKGLLLTIGYHDLFMGAPCSGFRSLITIFSLILVWVYINKSSLSKKIILISFIIPFALLGNLIRVIALCLITFYFGEEAGQGFFHNFSGILMFVITMTGLLGVEAFLDRKSRPALNSPESTV